MRPVQLMMIAPDDATDCDGLRSSSGEPTRPVQYENARVEPGWSSHEIETIDADTDL